MAKISEKTIAALERQLCAAAEELGNTVDVAKFDHNPGVEQAIDDLRTELFKAAIRYTAAVMTGHDASDVGQPDKIGSEWLAFVRKNPQMFAAAFEALLKELDKL